MVGACADDPERDAPDRDADDEIGVAAGRAPADASSARRTARIATSSVSPYRWIVSGPRWTTPLDGEGMNPSGEVTPRDLPTRSRRA